MVPDQARSAGRHAAAGDRFGNRRRRGDLDRRRHVRCAVLQGCLPHGGVRAGRRHHASGRRTRAARRPSATDGHLSRLPRPLLRTGALIGRPEIERALTGAWRLFLNKPDAMTFFDTGVDGFWRSFQAIVLVAPCYAVAALADRTTYADDIGAGQFSDAGFWTTKAVSLCVDWVALPILLALLSGFIGIRRAYPAYI